MYVADSFPIGKILTAFFRFIYPDSYWSPGLQSSALQLNGIEWIAVLPSAIGFLAFVFSLPLYPVLIGSALLERYGRISSLNFRRFKRGLAVCIGINAILALYWINYMLLAIAN